MAKNNYGVEMITIQKNGITRKINRDTYNAQKDKKGWYEVMPANTLKPSNNFVPVEVLNMKKDEPQKEQVKRQGRPKKEEITNPNEA